MIDIYKDPIWELMDMFSYPFERKIQNNGLRNVKRPHNLVNVKDDDGNIIAQKLTVVTTPFSKDDVKVTVADNMLSVTCGAENKYDKENEDVIYRGISSQSYSFALQLSPTVDKKNITAENKDGMLTISLPVKKEEEKKPDVIDIKID
jgi:HSP20 family molecular chaperone IbpA